MAQVEGELSAVRQQAAAADTARYEAEARGREPTAGGSRPFRSVLVWRHSLPVPSLTSPALRTRLRRTRRGTKSLRMSTGCCRQLPYGTLPMPLPRPLPSRIWLSAGQS